MELCAYLTTNRAIGIFRCRWVPPLPLLSQNRSQTSSASTSLSKSPMTLGSLPTCDIGLQANDILAGDGEPSEEFLVRFQVQVQVHSLPWLLECSNYLVTMVSSHLLDVLNFNRGYKPSVSGMAISTMFFSYPGHQYLLILSTQLLQEYFVPQICLRGLERVRLLILCCGQSAHFFPTKDPYCTEVGVISLL